MNARTLSLADPAVTEHFVCASARRDHIEWLAQSLVSAGAVESAGLDPTVLAQRIAVFNPVAVFIDFSGDQPAAAQAAADAVRRGHPDLPFVALGSLTEPESMLAAMRSGVTEFVDFAKPSEEALRITNSLLDRMGEPVTRHGKVAVLLGARAGMGVSTLASNLSVLLQKRALEAHRQVALLDLGLPAGDAALFLNTRCEFNFVEAVRNLRRFDRTFINTALARHASGMAMTTLPANLSELRDVSYASSVGLINRMRSFFDYQLIDLGGFSNREFVAHMARAGDEAWLMCDQSVASVVSTVDLLDGLREAGGTTENVRVIVNQYDPELGLTSAQIAERLGLPLVATLPSRRIPIGLAANQGKLIVDEAPRDPYVKALEALADRLAPEPANPAAARAGGLTGLKGLLSNSFSKRS